MTEALVALVVSPTALMGQTSETLPTFLHELEAAGHRFENIGVAAAEGYRKLGPDFPGMGEHWVHPGLVISGELDPDRPPVIGYTMVDGRRRLVSFAYTRVLGPDEAPPAAPFPGETWHDHTGGVDEESLLLSGPMSMGSEGTGYRLSMVHVWLPVANPAGTLSQNNWTLPFLRIGMPGSVEASSEAARALSLSTEEGLSFYEQLIREGVGLRGDELETATAVFGEAAKAAHARREHVSEAGEVTEADVQALEAIWADLWSGLERTLSGRSFEAMAPLRS